MFAEYGVSPRTRTRLHSLSGEDERGDPYVSPDEVDLILRDNAGSVDNDAIRLAILSLQDIRVEAELEREINAADGLPEDLYSPNVINDYYDWLSFVEDQDIVLDNDHAFGYHTGAGTVAE